MTFVERHWFSRDGLQLYARDYPSAAPSVKLPVFCLHGLTRNSRDFEDLAPFIAAKGRRVVVPDMRGRGNSEWDLNPTNYNNEIYAADTITLLDELQIKEAVFLGTSMGGAIIMTLAAVAGARISSAILNDVGGEIAAEGLARITRYAGKRTAVTNWAEAVAYAREVAGNTLPDRNEECWNRIARRIFVEDFTGKPMLDYDPAIMTLVGSAVNGPVNLWPLLDTLTTNGPVLVLRGAHSDILTAEVAKLMRDRVDNLVLETIPNVGHAPLLDEPRSLDALERFLNRVA